MKTVDSQEKSGTVLGILAILFWSATFAFSRSLMESIGILTAASYIYLLSGVSGSLYIVSKPKLLRRLYRLPVNYLIWCGSLFILYTVCLYLAIGLASNRQQVITVSMVNYLWPSFALIFSVPILNKKARIFLVPGIAIAFTGIIFATFQNKTFSWEIFKENFQVNFLPYILAFAAAVLWALYSNLSRRWASGAEGGVIPVFLLATGLILLLLRIIFPEESRWTPKAISELLYMAVFPTLLAYMFWDMAMRKGKIILVVSLSYFIPLASAIVSCLYLRVNFGTNLLISFSLIIAGSIICKFSIVDR